MMARSLFALGLLLIALPVVETWALWALPPFGGVLCCWALGEAWVAQAEWERRGRLIKNTEARWRRLLEDTQS